MFHQEEDNSMAFSSRCPDDSLPIRVHSRKQRNPIMWRSAFSLAMMLLLGIALSASTPSHAATVTREVQVNLGSRARAYYITWTEQGQSGQGKDVCMSEDGAIFNADVKTNVHIVGYESCGGSRLKDFSFMVHTYHSSTYQVDVTKGSVK